MCCIHVCWCVLIDYTTNIALIAWVSKENLSENENSFYSLCLCGLADRMFSWPAALFAIFNSRFCLFFGGRLASDFANFGKMLYEFLCDFHEYL